MKLIPIDSLTPEQIHTAREGIDIWQCSRCGLEYVFQRTFLHGVEKLYSLTNLDDVCKCSDMTLVETL